MHLENVLLEPINTEKTQKSTEQSNRYGFKVALRANKYQIKQAVEKLYDVKVVDVKTCITAGKTKRKGRIVSKTSKTKKALVGLDQGQSIEFYKDI